MQAPFHVANRARLMRTLPEGSLLLMFAGEPIRKTADEFYPLYANRNFLYLTGIGQERSALLLDGDEETLFALPKDEAREIWTGRRLTEAELTQASGVKGVRDIQTLKDLLHKKLSGGRRRLYLCLDRLAPDQPEDLEHRFAREIRERYPAVEIGNCYNDLAALRAVKTPEEVAAIEKAMRITEAGIRRMMALVRPNMMEYQLEAEFLHELAQAGQRAPAFPSIIASGERNFYLHYPSPHGQIHEGDLVLADVGAPFDHYHTDISRVFPAGGRFGERQAQIYQVAYAANRAIMNQVKPGEPFSLCNKICREVSFEGLRALGLIGDIADIGRYVWHGVAHHVGLDTHDVGGYERPMTQNMVFTVDAGIYVREWGVGLRIEDNVLVTGDGCRNLSSGIPVEIDEIEALMGEARHGS